VAQNLPADARERRRRLAGVIGFGMHRPGHFIRHVPIARANRRGKGDVVQTAVDDLIRAAFVEFEPRVDVFESAVTGEVMLVTGAHAGDVGVVTRVVIRFAEINLAQSYGDNLVKVMVSRTTSIHPFHDHRWLIESSYHLTCYKAKYRMNELTSHIL